MAREHPRLAPGPAAARETITAARFFDGTYQPFELQAVAGLQVDVLVGGAEIGTGTSARETCDPM